MSERAPRVAFFTPLPPARTGVANYAANLLPLLGRALELDVYVDQRAVECPAVTELFCVRHVVRFAERASSYDVLLYEMGNSLAHAGLYELSCHYPGIVHFHDLVLHHFLLAFYGRRGRWRDYRRELFLSHGADGLRWARCVERGFGGSLGYFALPLRGRAVERAVGAIVHSEWARRELRRERASLPILRIELPCFPRPTPVEPLEARRRFGIPPQALAVAAIGFVTPAKRIDRLLEAVRELRGERPEVWLLVVGEEAQEVALRDRARALGVSERCVLAGYVSEEDLWRAIDAADVVAALRFPTAGEASLPLMQALVAGKPAIVTDLPQFRDLPPEVCVKVPLGSREVAAIARAIRDLASRPELRERIGAAARRFATGPASPERAARSIAAFVRALRPLTRARLEAAIERMRGARRLAAERFLRRWLGGQHPLMPPDVLQSASGARELQAHGAHSGSEG